MAQEIINYGNTANDGTGDALRNAFIKVDNNFDQIWAAGPVGSNITVLNNTVAVTNTNGNLILSPNGVGIIQTNRPLYPRLDNTYDVGSANLRYRSIFVGAGGITNDGNLTLGNISNLRIPGGTNGYVIQTDGAGNLSFVAQSGSGNGSPGGSNTQVQFNNGGLFGGSNTFTFSNATSTMSVGNIVTSGLVSATGNIIGGNIGTVGVITATGNVTANYFLGNGSQITGNISGGNLITGGLVSATANIIGGNIRTVGLITATGNITGNYILGNGSQLSSLPGGVVQANVPPASPNATTLWWDEITGRLYVWYTDVDGSQWVDAAPAQGGYGNSNVASYLAVGGITTAISTTGNISGNYFVGNGRQLTDVTASVPSQTILPTIQTITVEARPAGLFGGGQGGANVTVANTIPVTEYGVIITDGTVSEKYKTGSLGSIPGTVSLTFTTGLNSAQFTVFAYVTSNAGTFYSNSATGTSGICLLAGTQIALSDGSHKAIEDITYLDKLLSWDFDRGCYAETTAVWIKRGETGSQYNLLTFSDGTTLRTFDQHRIFNKQAGAFTYPMTDATPVGTVTVNEHGQEITLINKQVIVDTIEYYNVITDHHMNLFSDTVLTSCRFNNIYSITDMKFVKDGRTLRTRAEFKNIPDRFFHGLRLAEQTTDIETVEWYVNRLLRTEVSTKSEITV